MNLSGHNPSMNQEAFVHVMENMSVIRSLRIKRNGMQKEGREYLPRRVGQFVIRNICICLKNE